MELLPVHRAPYDHKEAIKRQCCEILNDEWPRSETLRLRSLESSRDDLPMCLALVQWFHDENKKGMYIYREMSLRTHTSKI